MRACRRRSVVAVAAFALTIGVSACGTNSTPNLADPPPTATTTIPPPSAPPTSAPPASASPTSASAPTSTSTTLLAGLTPRVEKQLYALYINAGNAIDAVTGSPTGSPRDPRLARYDTGKYLTTVRAIIAQYRSQHVVYKETIDHHSQFRVTRPGPGSSWVADICEANNGDNYNATTGARVTHTGYGSSTLQFTAVPGPDRTWRISKLTQLPGSCAT
jgi:hypothetical protein